MIPKITRPEPVVQPPTKITVPSRERSKVFIFKEFGPDTYANIKSTIEQAGLRVPTMEDQADLLDPIYNSKSEIYDEPESAQIRKRMSSNWLWGFTGSQFLPKKDGWKLNNGVYVQDDPETREGMPYMDRQSLQDALEIGATEDQYGILWSADREVRFVPYDRFTLGEKSPSRLAKDPYVIALERGEEGAEKLARIADAEGHNLRPRIWGLKDTDTPQTRVSALCSNWGLDWRRLTVDGNCRGDGGGSYAFGVSENAGEARTPKK